MSDKMKAFIGLGILWVIIFCFLLVVYGCQPNTSSHLPPALLADGPGQALTTIVYKTNWLVTVGFLTCAAAVYTFFSGNGGKATPLFALGAFLIGGVTVYAALTEILKAWLPWFELIVPIVALIAVGVWTYNHYYRSAKVSKLDSLKSLLDTDKNGVVTVEEIKYLLGVK